MQGHLVVGAGQSCVLGRGQCKGGAAGWPWKGQILDWPQRSSMEGDL